MDFKICPKSIFTVLGHLKTVTELFKLRKLLKGDPPADVSVDGDYYALTTNDNSNIKVEKNTYNFYFNNPKVNEAISKTFKALEIDPSIEAFEVDDAKDQPLFEAERSDLSGMALTTSVPQPEKRDIPEEAQVYIVKPSFDPKLKWTILYKGIKIEAWMKDKEFQHRIDSGEQFAKGDRLAVRSSYPPTARRKS